METSLFGSGNSPYMMQGQTPNRPLPPALAMMQAAQQMRMNSPLLANLNRPPQAAMPQGMPPMQEGMQAPMSNPGLPGQLPQAPMSAMPQSFEGMGLGATAPKMMAPPMHQGNFAQAPGSLPQMPMSSPMPMNSQTPNANTLREQLLSEYFNKFGNMV